jgi:flavin-dependent dehydrogenase
MPPAESADFDLAVIGAGPAGLAAALTALQGGARVLLCEPQQGRRDKPCGEGLMPEGAVALETLGLADLCARGQRFESVRYRLPGGGELPVRLPSAGLSVTRPELIAELEAALDREAARRPGALTRLAAHAAVERLEQATGAARAETHAAAPPRFAIAAGGRRLRAAALVAADGLSGAVTRALFPPASGAPRAARGQRTGLRARFRAREPLGSVEVHLGRGAELYLTPLPRGEINAAALLDGEDFEERGAAELFARVRALYPEAERCLGEPLTPPGLRRLAALPPPRLAGGGAFVAGDASGGVDPVLGCGVTVALCSGLSAGRAALELLAGQPEARVSRAHIRRLRRELLARRRLAGLLCWLGRHPRPLAALAAVLTRAPILTRLALALVAGPSPQQSDGAGRPAGGRRAQP